MSALRKAVVDAAIELLVEERDSAAMRDVVEVHLGREVREDEEREIERVYGLILGAVKRTAS